MVTNEKQKIIKKKKKKKKREEGGGGGGRGEGGAEQQKDVSSKPIVVGIIIEHSPKSVYRPTLTGLAIITRLFMVFPVAEYRHCMIRNGILWFSSAAAQCKNAHVTNAHLYIDSYKCDHLSNVSSEAWWRYAEPKLSYARLRMF